LKAIVNKFRTNFPGDVYDLDRVIIEKKINPLDIVAIISKTTGSGELNDYSRQLAEINFTTYLNRTHGISLDEIANKIIFITSSGSEGIVTPHGYLIYSESDNNSDYPSKIKTDNNRKDRKEIKNEGKGLVIGTAKSCKIAVEKIGKMDQILLVAETTRQALYNSGISNIEDIGVVFVKSPVVSLKNVSDINLHNPKNSIPLTRAASALGVGLALGEISESEIKPEIIGTNLEIYSKKAFTFSGNEIEDCRVIILGNSNKGNSDYFIASSTFNDLMDIESTHDLLKSNEQNNLIGAFAKVSINPFGILRGQKIPLYCTSQSKDSVIRAVASGIFVPIFKNTEIFISGGGEHQGPNGGGILVAIFSKNTKSKGDNK